LQEADIVGSLTALSGAVKELGNNATNTQLQLLRVMINGFVDAVNRTVGVEVVCSQELLQLDQLDWYISLV
jgi:hypothetical protein